MNELVFQEAKTFIKLLFHFQKCIGPLGFRIVTQRQVRARCKASALISIHTQNPPKPNQKGAIVPGSGPGRRLAVRIRPGHENNAQLPNWYIAGTSHVRDQLHEIVQTDSQECLMAFSSFTEN